MSVKEMIMTGGGFLFIIMTLVEITPLKINPWSKIARALGKAFTSDVSIKLDALEKSNQDIIEQVHTLEVNLTKHEEKSDEQEAVNRRMRILRFGDEVIHGIKHTKEHFDQILEDITFYNNYCEEHKDFKNDKTIITTRRIKEVYASRLKNNDFL